MIIYSDQFLIEAQDDAPGYAMYCLECDSRVARHLDVSLRFLISEAEAHWTENHIEEDL